MKKNPFLALLLQALVILGACEKAEQPSPDDVTESEAISFITISDNQKADVVSALSEVDQQIFEGLTGGLKLNFQMSGITKLVIESVDANALAGEAEIIEMDGAPALGEIGSPHAIITFLPADGVLEAGKDYFVRTFPCDVYGGYRLSIFRDGQVAHFFGVHQIIEAGAFISPLDLIEDDLEFDDPDAPLVEEERPELDSKTKALLRAYKNNPCLDTHNALYEQMGVRYDKVVARKKAKLRELEREAKHQSLVEEMQAIVDEMVNNREKRLEQRFLSLIDSRKDDNPYDDWLVLKGATEGNCYVGYAPVTNAEYAAFDTEFTYPAGRESYPVVNVSIAQAQAYCDWLGTKDAVHAYRLPTEYEWILAAGHMPKDIKMNSNHIESGLTSVDAYASSKGGCGGIDFWGNCWEWTSTQTTSGLYIIKGGAWDSSRDECRSEYSDAARDGSKGYANVGIRVVRVDR